MKFSYFILFLLLLAQVRLAQADDSIVFQPKFEWADSTTTHQGTGSFVRAPNGSVVALTSAHFINFFGPKLVQASWLDIKTKQPIATFTCSWGIPGREGCYAPMDLRSDYLMLVVEGEIPATSVLEIDDREIAEVDERVWFPNKNPQAPLGYERIDGKITEAQNGYSIVILDTKIDLTTRSGTPVVSAKTGKVIGILTGGGEKNCKTQLFLAPAHSIRKAIIDAQNHPLLQEVIGGDKVRLPDTRSS